IGEADALLLVVDGRAGVTSVDHDLARQLRETGKPVFLAVNKLDHPTRDELVHDFHELGLGPPFAISAAHGRGVHARLGASAAATSAAPAAAPDDEEQDDDDQLGALDRTDRADQTIDDEAAIAAAEAQAEAQPLRVAFVGRPNAGKSSLTNRLLGEER